MKIKLKDGTTQIVVESICIPTSIVAEFTDTVSMDAFRAKLTDDNLTSFSYTDDADKVTGEYTNYTLTNTEYVVEDSKYIVTFSIRHFSETEVKLNMLNNAVAEMSKTVYA